MSIRRPIGLGRKFIRCADSERTRVLADVWLYFSVLTNDVFRCSGIRYRLEDERPIIKKPRVNFVWHSPDYLDAFRSGRLEVEQTVA